MLFHARMEFFLSESELETMHWSFSMWSRYAPLPRAGSHKTSVPERIHRWTANRYSALAPRISMLPI